MQLHFLQWKTPNPNYEEWKSHLVENPDIKGGEPVFPESRLSVYQIGSVLNRHENQLERFKQEILEDYPYLSQKDLRFAQMYVKRNPREERPE